LGIDFENTPFTNKYYYSYILPKANAEKLIADLFRHVGRKIFFGSVCGITRNANDGYNIYLDNKTNIQCKEIVVASGRSYPTMSLLKEIGQTFTDNHNLSLFNNSVFYHENWLSHDPFAVQYWCSIFRRSTKGLKYKGNIEIPLFSEEWEAQIF